MHNFIELKANIKKEKYVYTPTLQMSRYSKPKTFIMNNCIILFVKLFSSSFYYTHNMKINLVL